MNTSLKLDKKHKNLQGEYPLYVRLRGKLYNGNYSETSINTGVHLKENHFVNGVISPKTSNYTDKQRIINSILDDLSRIISEIIEEGLEPNPKFIKKEYEERIHFRELKTPQIQSFWKSFDEYLETKKNTSYGYRKTIITLGNHLKDFEIQRKKGSVENRKDFLQKDRTKKIISLLEKGKSVRDISSRLGVSTKTIVKVRKYVEI